MEVTREFVKMMNATLATVRYFFHKEHYLVLLGYFKNLEI